MISCAECIERMKPDDPRAKAGRYHMCGCDYCNKPTYYRELETKQVEPQEQIITHRHSDIGKQEFDLLQEHERAIKFLMSKQARKKQQLGKIDNGKKPKYKDGIR